MTHVKICGLTHTEDARFCSDAGARYLGVIFAGGPRLATIAQVLAIREAAPGARLVGVFADQPLPDMVAAAAACRLDMLQLHGRESDAQIAAVADATGLDVIKALRPGDPIPAAASHLLFDLPKGREPEPGLRDLVWDAARQAVEAGRSVFLAGKLSPEDVARAIAEVGPHALDVASGVESAPGRKDHALVAAFMEEVERVSQR